MNELLMKRIQRRLENLDDEQGYRVLDYVEFLESKYGTRERGATVFEKIADGVEDTLRATRVPKAAIKGTMGAVGAATKVMDRLADAGRAAVEELGKNIGPPSPTPDSGEGNTGGSDDTDAPDPTPPPPAEAEDESEPTAGTASPDDGEEDVPTG